MSFGKKNNSQKGLPLAQHVRVDIQKKHTVTVKKGFNRKVWRGVADHSVVVSSQSANDQGAKSYSAQMRLILNTIAPPKNSDFL